MDCAGRRTDDVIERQVAESNGKIGDVEMWGIVIRGSGSVCDQVAVIFFKQRLSTMAK